MSLAMQQPPTLPLVFDYADLDSETRIVVQQKTGEIKERLRRTASDIIEVGERLTDIKARLGHGKFGSWLKSEFNWSERTAQNFMEVSRAFESANFADLNFAPSALYALAAPSVPDEARQEAIEVARAGRQVTHKDAKAIVAKHKPEPTTIPEEPNQATLFESKAASEAVPADGEPEGEPTIELSATPVTQCEKIAEDWGKIVSQYLFLANSVRRRGGMKSLAQSWPKSKVRDARQVCTEVASTFNAYREELKELRK